SAPHHSHSGQRSSTCQCPSPCSCQVAGWTRIDEQLGHACIPPGDLPVRGSVLVRLGTPIVLVISGASWVSFRPNTEVVARNYGEAASPGGNTLATHGSQRPHDQGGDRGRQARLRPL